MTLTNDVIDSREIIEEIEQLTADGTDPDRLAQLMEFAAQASDSDDWEYGVTVIHEDYFETYAHQLAEDTGLLSEADDHWPYTCIDWERAADELENDYDRITFDGVDYLIRS